MEKIMALTKLEKKYLALASEKLFKENDNVTEEDLKVLAEEIDKPITIVTNYINTLVIKHKTPDQPLTQSQINIRNIMSGVTAGGRDGITIMSDASSSMIEGSQKTNNPPTKHDRVIYRGNPRPKR